MKAERLLKKGLRQLKLPFDENQINAFLVYLDELKRWRRAYNLTGLKTDEDIVIKHFLDSLLYLKVISKKMTVIADAGSGAGFPGIPLKIIRPDVSLTLIESTRKKASFLRHMVRVLELKNTTVYQNRIEELGDDELGRYDVIVTRATFKIEEFLEKACPYVRDGGFMVISKGQRFREELKDTPRLTPFIKNILRVQLPFIRATRNLVVLECKNFYKP
jgi:16S rRNA (guanine527-N7)-methyltransferase